MVKQLAADGLPEGFFGNEDKRFYTWLASCVQAGGTFVEVGSYLGRSAVVAAAVLRPKGCRMVCVDTWLGTPGDATSRKTALLEAFRDNVDAFGFGNYITPLQMTSAEAAETFADSSVDAVFIDADHSHRAVKIDLAAWVPKLKAGCIIAGHDYYASNGPAHCVGVKRAVDEAFGKPDGLTGSCWHVQLTADRRERATL
jgi:predicted O-methyltransferase YrrM